MNHSIKKILLSVCAALLSTQAKASTAMPEYTQGTQHVYLCNSKVSGLITLSFVHLDQIFASAPTWAGSYQTSDESCLNKKFTVDYPNENGPIDICPEAGIYRTMKTSSITLEFPTGSYQVPCTEK